MTDEHKPQGDNGFYIYLRKKLRSIHVENFMFTISGTHTFSKEKDTDGIFF